MKIKLEFETSTKHESIEDALCHILGKEYHTTLTDIQMEIDGRLKGCEMMEKSEADFLRELLKQIQEAPCMDYYR